MASTTASCDGAGCSGTRADYYDAYPDNLNHGGQFTGTMSCSGGGCSASMCDQSTCNNQYYCNDASDCSGSTPACVNNTCMECDGTHACSGNCEFCNSGVCDLDDNKCNGCMGCGDDGNCHPDDDFCSEYGDPSCSDGGTTCQAGCCCTQATCETIDPGCTKVSDYNSCIVPGLGCIYGGTPSADGTCCETCSGGYVGACGGDDGAFRFDPQIQPTGGPCQTDGNCASGYYCDPNTCTCQDDEDEDAILIDLSGAGYLLTNVKDGVEFDIFASGKPRQLAWSATGSGVGFLVLDRSGNGKIDGGAELFTGLSPQGVVTGPHNESSGSTPVRPQPATGAAALDRGSRQGKPVTLARRNGFAALALYDQPATGGNGDSQIDAQDAVYSRLRVWVDKNHDGISQPEELLTLAELGITSISLHSEPAQWTDAYGNRFSSRVTVIRNGAAEWAYDVFLTVAK